MKESIATTQDNTWMDIIEQSAKALGGVDRIRNLHTLRLYGYAQYAYMWGAGNICASPDAPQKLLAANDLQRVWDFDNNGFQLKERRNMLFPFAAIFGHAFFPLNQILDGTIAYNKLPDGNTVRVGEFSQDPMTVDGRRIRKLWSLTNPVSMLNAILNNKAQVSNLRTVNELDVMDVTVDKNVSLVFAINHDSKIPQYVQWFTAQTNLGEITFTTTFTAYMPFNGIQLPMGYNTKMDFRDTVYFRMYVDGYKVDEPVESLKAPSNVVEAIAPAGEFVPPIELEVVDDGVWRIAGIGGTTIVEFEDHLTIFELYWSQLQAKAIIEKANTLVPNKKVTELIISHYHFDHTGGFRAAVAAGLKVYSCRGNEAILREMAERPTPHFNDVLAPEANKKFEFVPIDEHLRLSDNKATVDIYRVVSNCHMADAVFAYMPDKKLFMDSDIATAAYDWQIWPDSYLDNIEHYSIEVEKVSTVHEKVMTHNEVLEYIEGGRQRALQRGSQYEKMNEYLPGYPIFQTRNN
jgi:hypothetical protein